MKFKVNLITIGILLSGFSQGVVLDVEKLKNDKEVTSVSLTGKVWKKISNSPLSPEDRSFYKQAFLESLKSYSRSENLKCELKVISTLESKIASRPLSFKRIYQELRVQNEIDDVLYDLLIALTQDFEGLKRAKTPRPGKQNAKALDIWDFQKLYGNFNLWPDEETNCALQEFVQLKEKITLPGKKPDLKLLSRLNAHAFHLKLISLETFAKLEYLTKESALNKRKLWLQDYLKVIMLAKNRLVPKNQNYTVTDLSKEHTFPSKKLRRFSRLTQRKLLYRKYDETQILLLAQVLKKSSQRMGVDPDTKSSLPTLTQEFTIKNDNGDSEIVTETITLDPQSQYNLARRLLRKDMIELQMMDSFREVKVTFSDVVMAALETGYITHDDLKQVIEYDDLWNPHISKFERIRNFVFNVIGYGTFFIPAPWNVTTSIALGVVENMVDNFYATGEDNDNPATFIE